MVPQVEREAATDALRVLRARTWALHATPVRNDSRLAFQYAINKLQPSWTLDHVAFELALTRYLYEHTEYPEMVRREMPRAISALKKRAGISHSVARSVAQVCAIPIIRLQAMRHLAVPDVWPWMALQQPSPRASEDAGPDASAEVERSA